MHVVFDSLKKEFGDKVVLDTGYGEIMHGRSTAITMIVTVVFL